MNKLIGQHLIIGLSGPTLTPEEKTFIIDNNIAGVVLFARNLIEPKQIHELCTELQSLRHKMIDKAPLFISVDMEGGRVARLKSPFTIWPAVKNLGDLDNPTITFHFANRMGQELKAIGINLDFAPCVDIFSNPKNTVIGDRSVGSDPELVAKHTSALVRGYIKSGIISCAKHFPGHGNTLIDSHEDLPVENADLKRLNDFELVPFKRSFRARVDMVMSSHIQFPKVDPKWPVTLSETFLKNILRDDIRFRGIVVSDDLGMKAMTKHFEPEIIPVRALQAGVEILLYCNEPDAPPKAIEDITTAIAQGSLQKEQLQTSYMKIMNLKKDKLAQPDPLSFSEAMKIIGNADHTRLAEAILKKEVPQGFLSE